MPPFSKDSILRIIMFHEICELGSAIYFFNRPILIPLNDLIFFSIACIRLRTKLCGQGSPGDAALARRGRCRPSSVPEGDRGSLRRVGRPGAGVQKSFKPLVRDSKDLLVSSVVS